MRRRRLRLLLVTPEITELPRGMGNAANFIRAKGGGLGDMSAALINHLHGEDLLDFHVALPKYSSKIQRDFARLSSNKLDRLSPRLRRQGVHLVADSAFSHLQEVYSDSVAHPRLQRSIAFQRHVINYLLPELRPDVVHCNDWMTGLIPAAAQSMGIKSVFTVHNIFTEWATLENVDKNGIDVRRFAKRLYFTAFPDHSEANWRGNKVDFLASGIFAATWVNTVSPTFLEELVRGEFPELVPTGVRDAMRMRVKEGRASGILNAPSDQADPRRNAHVVRYGVDEVIAGKGMNKREFQRQLGLAQNDNAPLFLWPSRLFAQKSPDLLYAVARDAMQALGAQLALVANGDRRWESRFDALASQFPQRIASSRFQQPLSDLGKAGADFILMPSRYEPCGLPQMEGARFGTLPVARNTGGLRDTVQELDLGTASGNGFVFGAADAAGLFTAMRRAARFRRLGNGTRAPVLQRVMREAQQTFSLQETAQSYVEVYASIARRNGAAAPKGATAQ